ncbi:MAG: DNA starvation/stationary phase protection protein Dps [Opitutaceae bacterium]|nr:DNA starvation/stationary phase protection protein Dps [Opitutaceae bacterium]
MKTTTWNSPHDLPETVRLQIVPLLNRQLADAIDLTLQAKQAHWNVKGPQFVSLHGLFDEVAETLGELADELAERSVELGGVADGTLQAVAGATRLPAYDRELLSGTDHLRALAAATGNFAQSSRGAIDAAATLGDASTADLFTSVSRAADKLLWKLSAHAATPA